MGNLKNYNFNKIDMYLSNSQYYDLYLAQDEYTVPGDLSGLIDDCMVVHYDFNNNNIFVGGNPYSGVYGPQYGYNNDISIHSLVSWTGATNSGFTFSTFGLTGIDNGYIRFNKYSGDTCNTGLTSTLTGTTVITSGDTMLILNEVTGATGNYVYPIEQVSGGTEGNFARFCGGFYQGYYKLDGYNYEVLPTRVPKAWVAELWLRKSDNSCSNITGTTLNDTYPDNKGFFFYMGTRAENKFWNIFEGNNTGCTSGCCTISSGCTGTVTTFCTPLKETDVSFVDGDGNLINLSPPPIEYNVITNPFLIYGQADGSYNKCSIPSGLGNKTVCNFTGNSITVSGITQQLSNTQNPFLIYGQAGSNSTRCADPSGLGNKTVCNFSGLTSPLLELDKDADIIDNAIGFRIKDDGSIGYRALKLTAHCENNVTVTGVTVEEQYSLSGVVSDDVWHKIDIRFVMPEYDECDLKYGKPRKGRLMFYIDCKLKFVAEEVDEFIAKRLNEHKDKQLGVPFNMSLGGGTQGLLESMTFDGQDSEDLGLHIEQNFAGTFIGDISQFRFHICDLSWCALKNNCDVEKGRYGK